MDLLSTDQLVDALHVGALLTRALARDNALAMRQALSLGADPQRPNKEGLNALFLGAERGSSACVEAKSGRESSSLTQLFAFSATPPNTRSNPNALRCRL